MFEELAGRFGDSWWQEVILLMLAQRNPTVFEEFMRQVVARPGFVEWASSETMALALNEAANVSAVPFVELLEAAPGPEGAERQLAAAKLLHRAMPEVLRTTERWELLLNHPSEQIREWWQGLYGVGEPADETIVAPVGGVELVRVPGGAFQMGSPETEEGRSQLESPRNTVELASFYMAKTAVTNAQYGEYLKENLTVDKPAYWGDRRYNQPEQPVVGVSWHEARAYCEWAGLSLPTAAQWEYACRAGG